MDNLLWITSRTPLLVRVSENHNLVGKPCLRCADDTHNLWSECLVIHRWVINRLDGWVVHSAHAWLSTGLIHIAGRVFRKFFGRFVPVQVGATCG